MQVRPDIHGLRAIAVLAVIIFHLNPPGYQVDLLWWIFFSVISAYLVPSILLHKKIKEACSESHEANIFMLAEK